MAKGGRGGKRGMGGGGGQWSPNLSANPDQAPTSLRGALGKKGKEKSMVDAMLDANPHYSETFNEFSENCQRCVMAYEMRRRGYDVEALPTYQGDEMPKNGNWQKALKGMTEKAVGRSTESATIKQIEKQMSEWGDGARAILRIKWAGSNSGHVINVEYQKGKMYVYDAQSNRRNTNVNLLKEYMPYTTLARTELFRTDNASITQDMKYMVKHK